ncbi:MAG: helix-turn-helix transcriptional regulator [Cyanobacteriota bacterium]|nr:helix-turn-helix transcriptional regulator [Cyanobacteriota bacterium]
MSQNIPIQPSSGNLFADLGLPNPEEMRVNAKLVHQINTLVSQRNLATDETAQLLETDRVTLSALKQGKLTDFATEQLFGFLNALGCDVEIIVKHKPDAREKAHTRVNCGIKL